MKSLAKGSKSLRMGASVACILVLAGGLLAWHQVTHERDIDLEDIDRRAHALAYQISFVVIEALARPIEEGVDALAPRLEGYGRLFGFAVYRADGRHVASAKAAARFCARSSVSSPR